MRSIAAFRLSILALSLVVLFVPLAGAQITRAITANIGHSFIIGNTTLPAGKYVFRMLGTQSLTSMIVSSANDATSVEFLVREATDSHVPSHSELIFRRYGNKEFLARIFQVGTKDGVAVEEPSHEEARLKKQGQNAVEHTEEESK